MAKSKNSSTRPKKLKEFTCFPKLAQELQDMVWKLALPDANVVQIYAVRISYAVQVLKASYQVPALLHVCRESRLVARKRYQTIFDAEFGDKHVYFNPARDVLFIRDSVAMLYLWKGKNFIPWHEKYNKFSSPIMKDLGRLQLGSLDCFCWYGSLRNTLEAFGRPEFVVFHRPSHRIPSHIGHALESAQEQLLNEWTKNNGKNGDYYKELEIRLLTSCQLAKLLKSIDNPAPSKPTKAEPNLAPARRSERLFGVEVVEYKDAAAIEGDDGEEDST